MKYSSRHTDASEESTQSNPKSLCSWINNRLNATNYDIRKYWKQAFHLFKQRDQGRKKGQHVDSLPDSSTFVFMLG
jgi:hypothetical protein